MNVLYDDKGNEYPIDDASQLYVPLGFEQTVVEDAKEETEKSTKNYKDLMQVWSLMVPQCVQLV